MPANPIGIWTLLSLIWLALVFGCNSGSDATNSDSAITTSENSSPATTDPLRVIVVDDEALAEALLREWRENSDQPIALTNNSTDDVLRELSNQTRLATDVIIFPSNLLGAFADARLLRPTPQDLAHEAAYNNSEIYDLVRRREMQWNRQPYALPFGSPVFVLLRRTDLVPDAPETWKELNTEVERLASVLPGDMIPLAQPLAKGWAAKMLLARAAPYLYDSSKVSTLFDFATMEPRIHSAPFWRAAEELRDSLHGGEEVFEFTPASAAAALMDGKAAMAITWLSNSSEHTSLRT